MPRLTFPFSSSMHLSRGRWFKILLSLNMYLLNWESLKSARQHTKYCYITIFILANGRYCGVVYCCHLLVIFVDCVSNVMAHAQKPDFVFRRNGRVHLNRRGRQYSRLLAAEVCTSAVVMLDTPCSEVVWRVLDTHSFHQFPFRFPSCASPFTITFQLDSNYYQRWKIPTNNYC
jgi:hypothetical protein